MFADKVVLVTGGTSGIGLALARRFSAAGANVVVCGRNRERLDATARTLPGVTALPCDVADPAQLRHLLAEIETRFAKLDILVSNAGSLTDLDFTAAPLDPALIEAEIRTNLVAPMTLTSLAMPLLRQADRATIVLVTSGYALAPATRAPAYSAAKAGLRAFAKSLRRQLEPLGIAVVEVVPPLVDTPAVAHRPGRKLPPDEVAAATLKAVAARRPEALVGDTRLLPTLLRLAPGFAEGMVGRS